MILSATNKGGVGKSYVVANIVQYLKEHPSKPSFRCFDPDHANKTLLGIHPDVTEFIDVSQPQSLDKVCACLADVDVSVADGLGSQQRKTFQKWVEEIDLLQLAKDIGFRVTYLLVIEDDQTVLDQTIQIVDLMEDKVDWVVALNHKQVHGVFQLWSTSKIRQRLQDYGALEFDVENIHAHMSLHLSMQKLCLSNVQDWKPKEGELPVNAMDRARFKTAWIRLKAELDKAAPYLLPEGGEAIAKTATASKRRNDLN